MKICNLYVDPKILKFAIDNDLIMFGLESAKYDCHGLNAFARGIEETIRQKELSDNYCNVIKRYDNQKKNLDKYTENSLKHTNVNHEL